MTPIAFLAIASGHWPTVIHVTLIWVAYLLLRVRPAGRALAVSASAMGLAALLAGPQLLMTMSLMAKVTRQKIGYAMAGENSFFPADAVLALFPHIMGSRTPNFFPQQWWGAWHLCEMLGYVGLATLALAMVAVLRLWRPGTTMPPHSMVMANLSTSRDERCDDQAHKLSRIVRVWMWILLGAGLFMLGFYLPTYRLVHMLPGLGVVRAPARMMLAVDLGLATLAAVAVHAVMTMPRAHARARRLRQSICRALEIALPVLMLATVGLLAVGGWLMMGQFPQFAQKLPILDGGARDVLDAVKPTNPALWTQVLVLAATIVAARYWLSRPRRRWPAMALVLLADLFLVTGFVDVPGKSVVPVAPQQSSPVANWLAQNDPDQSGYRVWGLGLFNADGQLSYNRRCDELLLPKTCEAMGVSTIGNYGPFQSALHVQTFGFRIWGANRNWPWLIRRNHLLSLYGVKYIIASEPLQREVIESVQVVDEPAKHGPNLLAGQWQGGDGRDGVLSVQASGLWTLPVRLRQPIRIEVGRWYRIALDARAPAGAGNYLRAEVALATQESQPWDDPSNMGLNVEAQQLGSDWRHFEWSFEAPQAGGDGWFDISTPSESAIELRSVTLCQSSPDRPINLSRRLSAGENVYELVADLPPRDLSQSNVAIYRNKLWMPLPVRRFESAQEGSAVVEQIKWAGDELADSPPPWIVDVSLPAAASPMPAFWGATLPGAALYSGIMVIAVLPKRRKCAEAL